MSKSEGSSDERDDIDNDESIIDPTKAWGEDPDWAKERKKSQRIK